MPFKDGRAIEASTYGNPSSFLQEEVFVQQRASFVSFPVTKPVVTQGTTRHQMKDMNIIFPLIPLNFLRSPFFYYVFYTNVFPGFVYFRLIQTLDSTPYFIHSVFYT